MRFITGCAIATILASVPALADELSCKDASAFYHYAMFSSKAIGAVSGACAEDTTQPACIAFMAVVTSDDGHLDKAQMGDVQQHLRYLKDRCPDHFPENPGEF